ncbi:hypothetical protein D3C87_737280 [compost metagenome]
MKQLLREGLREQDLEDLVIPMISIDEFESKVDDDAIVIGFYVKDSEPADDLNRFIQKSPVILLDTDVSPAPNADGYFLVFVEVSRDGSFPKKLETILAEIKNLVAIEESDWSFTCYGHDGIFEATEENVRVLIRTESIEDLKQKAFDDDLLEFFKPSIIDDFRLDENLLSISRNNTLLSGELVSFGEADQLDEAILGKAVTLTEDATRSCRRWEALLGEGWEAHIIEPNLLLSNAFNANVLVLKIQ